MNGTDDGEKPLDRVGADGRRRLTGTGAIFTALVGFVMLVGGAMYGVPDGYVPHVVVVGAVASIGLAVHGYVRGDVLLEDDEGGVTGQG